MSGLCLHLHRSSPTVHTSWCGQEPSTECVRRAGDVLRGCVQHQLPWECPCRGWSWSWGRKECINSRFGYLYAVLKYESDIKDEVSARCAEVVPCTVEAGWGICAWCREWGLLNTLHDILPITAFSCWREGRVFYREPLVLVHRLVEYGPSTLPFSCSIEK